VVFPPGTGSHGTVFVPWVRAGDDTNSPRPDTSERGYQYGQCYGLDYKLNSKGESP
jgi:hypothetical protein